MDVKISLLFVFMMVCLSIAGESLFNSNMAIAAFVYCSISAIGLLWYIAKKLEEIAKILKSR